MPEQTFYIARCDISRTLYRLTIADDGRTVTDMAPARLPLPRLYSANRRRVAYTDDSLRPCPVCSSRRVGGCSCAREQLPCEANTGFRFACIYCDRLQIIGKFTADAP